MIEGEGGLLVNLFSNPSVSWNLMVLYHYFNWAPCCYCDRPERPPVEGEEGGAKSD